jgi:hypothetical protein
MRARWRATRSNPGATGEELDCFVASAPKKKQMSKALIKSSFFRASYAGRLDCSGARAPRNDGVGFFALLFPSLRAQRSNPGATREELDCFVASAPRNDGVGFFAILSPSLRAQRSNPVATRKELDCFVASAPRNDGGEAPDSALNDRPATQRYQATYFRDDSATGSETHHG